MKAVHLVLVSDLTTDAFIACLHRFMARRGKPMLIWSDHSTNFVGAAQEIKELTEYLWNQKTQRAIPDFVLYNMYSGNSHPSELHTLEASGRLPLGV